MFFSLKFSKNYIRVPLRPPRRVTLRAGIAVNLAIRAFHAFRSRGVQGQIKLSAFFGLI